MIYLLGEVGYSLSTVHRVIKVLADIVLLIRGIALAVRQSSSTPLKKSGVHLLQDLAEVPAALIGIACPPLAYRIDAWLCRATGRSISFFENYGYEVATAVLDSNNEGVRRSLNSFDSSQIEIMIARSLTDNTGDETSAAEELAGIKPLCQQAGALCGKSCKELDLALLVRVVLLLYLQKSGEAVFEGREVHQYAKKADFDGKDFEAKLGELRKTFKATLEEDGLVKKLMQEWMQSDASEETAECTSTLSQQLLLLAGRYVAQDRVGTSWMLKQAMSSFIEARPEELFSEQAIRIAVEKAYSGLYDAEKNVLREPSKEQPPKVNAIKDLAASMMLYFYVTSLSGVPEGDEELAKKTKEAYDAYQAYKETGRRDDLVTIAKKHFREGKVSFPNITIAAFFGKLEDLKETYMEEEGRIFGTLLKQCHHPQPS